MPLIGKRRGPHQFTVRLVSVLCALGVMYAYSIYKQGPSVDAPPHTIDVDSSRSSQYMSPRRHLLSTYQLEDDNDGSGDDDGDDTNCTNPRGQHNGYNDSCSFVLDNCGDTVQLFNYMELVLCRLRHVQWLGYVILSLWLLYLISLLATTADNFFVPPLNLLSEKLRLSPSIAGITLLAIGNGAPDVFTAYASLKQDKVYLLLGALLGASIFISTVVLGTIILTVKVKSEDIDKIDFVRDVTVYMLAVGLVIGVAFDGKVYLMEAISFLLFYLAYIAVVVIIMFIRKALKRRSAANEAHQKETDRLVNAGMRNESTADFMNGVSDDDISKEVKESIKEVNPTEEKQRLVLLGLTYPRGSNIGVKIQWFLEWPVSLLRWFSVPPCYYDGQWTPYHHWFAVSSPVPMVMVLLVAAQGWDGFTTVYLGKLPLWGFLVMLGVTISVAFFFLLSYKKPPHWSMQIVLGTLAFIMSIAWLNIEANEVVAVLNSFGLMFGIDVGILGLTVLAIGNSVGDWVADTAVARAGKPGMGIASCFGSPLLNDVIGLSVALIARSVMDHGRPYMFPIHSDAFSKVKLSWIFLGISLVSSAIVFPVFRFSPPKAFGAALLYLYVVFMVFSILMEVNVLPIHFR